MKATEFSDIFEKLESFPRKYQDFKTLIQTTEHPRFKITNKEIKLLRDEKRPQVESELLKLVQNKDDVKGTYQRLKFMNKFYLYAGLQKMYEQSDSPNKDVFHKSLDTYENSLMDIFNCDQDWPICLYDFTYKNKIPQYLCFRTHKEAPTVIENYFYANESN